MAIAHAAANLDFLFNNWILTTVWFLLRFHTYTHTHPSSYTLPLVYVTVVIVIIIKLHSSITIAYYDT